MTTMSQERLTNITTKDGEAQLISLYIPPNRLIKDVVLQLRNEQSHTINIKNDTVKNNIWATLDKIIRFLMPHPDQKIALRENGLVIFAGYIEGGIHMYETRPTKKHVDISLYRCDNRFYTEPLKELI